MEINKWAEEIRVIKGYNRICLYDLNRNNYQFVPKEVDELITKIEGKDLNEIILTEIEIDWYNDFIQKEYFFKINKKLFKYFTPLNLNWENPSFIVNAVFYDTVNNEKTINFLDNLICKYLTIYINDLDKIEDMIIKHFLNSNFYKIDFIITSQKVNKKNKNSLLKKYKIINSITQNINQNFSKNEIFTVNNIFFFESQLYNPYFNRKIFIDENGDIKNSNESSEIHGNINQINSLNEIKKIISNSNFQKYWKVNKDICDVCKDCELRYMCLDSRIPIKRNEFEYYFNEECDYNPYISKWKNDQGYKTLMECEITSNENNFSINKNLLNQINETLWSEV